MDNVTLNRGEYYQRVTGTTLADDMTGWYVESSIPVTVVSGAKAAAVGSSSGASDHLVEQVLPIEALASVYVASPTNSRPIGCTTCTQDVFRYIATEDNTVITTSPNLGTKTLQKGEFWELTTNVPHIATGTHPFYGFQYLGSQLSGTPQAGTGDPSLLAMPMVDQFQYRYMYAVPTSFAYNFINVTAPAGINFTIDGALVSPNWLTAGTINGITYRSATIPTTPGVHRMIGDQKYGLSVTGFGPTASYGYMGGSGLAPINAGCISGGPYQVLSCDPGTNYIQLNGRPTCGDGSTPIIQWSSTDGVVFSDPTIANPVAIVSGYGIFEITMTVNCGGNITSCSTDINIAEQLSGCAMSLQPPPDVTVYTDHGENYASNVNIGTATYSSPAAATLTNNALTQYPIGVTTVTWMVKDIYGRSKSASHSVTVIPYAPEITAPPAVRVPADAGQSYATAVVLGVPVVVVSARPGAITNDAPLQFPIGTTTVTWTVTDSIGQTASAAQVVTVVPPPVITAPPAITVTAGYDGFATVNDLQANGNASYTVYEDPALVTISGALVQYPVGTTNVTWTVEDGYHRTASGIQQVIVLAPLPVISLVAAVTVSNDPGVTFATLSLVPPTYQAIGPVTLTNDAPATFPLGTTTVTWILTDKYGKQVTATQDVTVVAAPPSITPPAAITVAAGATGFATAVNIGTATYSVSVNPAVVSNNAPVQYPIGNTTITWTVTDGLGRTASGTQVITVVNGCQPYAVTVTSIPTDNTPTGGNPNNLYIGYGAQSTKLQVNVPNTSGPHTFHWTGAMNKLSSATSAAPIFAPGTDAGTYTYYVTCTNANGCSSATSSITICVRDVRSLDKNGHWDGKKVIVCHLPPGNVPNVQMIDVSIKSVPAHVPLHGGDGLGNSCIQPSCTSPYARGIVPVAETFGVTVYPNPTPDGFALKVKSDDKYTRVTVRIVDAFGRTVEVFNEITVGRTILFGDKYASGSYYAEVIQGSDRKLIPVVKAK
jgi:hypothetical protein